MLGMADHPAPDQRLGLILDEATRAISQQKESLDGLRSRAGTLISATAISTSFLGGFALEQGPLTCAGILAVVAFVLVILLTLAILLPLWTWWFQTRPSLLVGMIEGNNPPGLDQLRRDLALHFEDFYEINRVKLNVLFGAFVGAGALLMIEIILWVVEIALD